MSLVLNMVGGGGGSLKDTDAILTVTVPTGSTVTITKGGVTLTPTMWVQAADPTLDCALFVIAPSLFDAQNAWTVTATLSGDTASDTVIIDSNKQYDIALSFRTFLFDNGVILQDLGSFKNISSVSISNNAITAVKNQNGGNYFGFQNPIAFKSYGNSLHVLISQTSVTAAPVITTKIGAFSSLPVGGTYASNESRVVVSTQYTAVQSDFTEVLVDISGLTPGSSYYLAGIAVASFVVSKIWISP